MMGRMMGNCFRTHHEALFLAKLLLPLLRQDFLYRRRFKAAVLHGHKIGHQKPKMPPDLDSPGSGFLSIRNLQMCASLWRLCAAFRSQLQPIRAGFGKKFCLPQDVHISREIWNLVTRFFSPAGRQSQVYFKLLDGFIAVSKVKIFNKRFRY